jgi:hypothetical protein
MSMRIEILTFSGCPNAYPTRELVRQAIRIEGVDAQLLFIDVDSPDAASRLRFLGSPSVRVDGEDIEASANDRTGYGLMCRTYSGGAGVAGTPSIDMIREAIRRRASVNNRVE